MLFIRLSTPRVFPCIWSLPFCHILLKQTRRFSGPEGHAALSTSSRTLLCATFGGEALAGFLTRNGETSIVFCPWVKTLNPKVILGVKEDAPLNYLKAMVFNPEMRVNT